MDLTNFSLREYVELMRRMGVKSITVYACRVD